MGGSHIYIYIRIYLNKWIPCVPCKIAFAGPFSFAPVFLKCSFPKWALILVSVSCNLRSAYGSAPQIFVHSYVHGRRACKAMNKIRQSVPLRRLIGSTTRFTPCHVSSLRMFCRMPLKRTGRSLQRSPTSQAERDNSLSQEGAYKGSNSSFRALRTELDPAILSP